MTKQCSKCEKELSLSAFYKRKSSKDGRVWSCKKCQAKRAALLHIEHKAKDPHHNQRKKLKEKYGLTLEEYDQMLEEQNGVCAVCHKPERVISEYGIVRRLAVDHNHTTGKVRGLLCQACNTTLGKVSESIEVLLQLAIYLEGDK